jgi:hypothetical protein
MTDHRYKLQKGGKKHSCPECNKKTFVLFIDTQSGELLPDEYGRCDREVNCGWFNDPYKSGYAKMISDKEKGENVSYWKPFKPAPNVKPQPLPPSFIPSETFKHSRTDYDNNNFAQFLINRFSEEIAIEKISQYHIGTSKHQFSSIDYPGYRSDKGSTVFWQIDINGKVRTGKIMLYDTDSGKRIKEPFGHISWAHKALKIEGFNLSQVLFGEHLVGKFPDKPVAVVESEKTAIIASIYLPVYNWVAVGALTNLKPDRCTALKGRKVYLFPDLKCFDKWKSRAEELRIALPGTSIITSEILEKNSSDQDKQDGLDIADFMLRYDLENFKEMMSRNATPPPDKPKPEGVAKRDTLQEDPEVENVFDESLPAAISKDQFNETEYREWFQNAGLPKKFIMNQGSKNEFILYDLNAFVTGRLLAIGAYVTAIEPDRNELLLRRSKFIRQLQYIRKRATAPVIARPKEEPVLV